MPDPGKDRFLVLAARAWDAANAKGKRVLMRLIKQGPVNGMNRH